MAPADAPQRLDYLSEAMALERQGDYDAALTSYKLALRDRPNDTKILQNMAIAFTKTHRPEEAIRYYRHALEVKPDLSGPTTDSRSCCSSAAIIPGAERHLEAFLAKPPRGAEAERWMKHAQATLDACVGHAARTPRRIRAVAWERFSRSSVRRAASARPRPRSISRPRSLAAAQDAAHRRRPARLGPLRCRALGGHRASASRTSSRARTMHKVVLPTAFPGSGSCRPVR